ncbi:MAG: hemolysin family protein [Anaerolineales bacterium]|nr:hemolysin family protein [Anaerolineales bacterium]
MTLINSISSGISTALNEPLIIVVPVLITAALIFVNGVFVAAEFAIIGVRRTQMEQLAKEGNARASRVLSILETSATQDRYIATAQLGITLASIGLAMYAEPRIAHFIEPYLTHITSVGLRPALTHSLATIIALTLLTYLHVVLGEMAPKALALSAPRRTALVIVDMMHWAQKLLFIPVTALNAVGLKLLAMMRMRTSNDEARLHSPQELVQIVSESALSGLLKDNERALLLGVFDFSKRRLNQVMTPRNRLKAIAHDTALEDILNDVVSSSFSRFPVYQDNLDHIIGILHVKDLARQHMDTLNTFNLHTLLHPAHHLPENAPLGTVLSSLKDGPSHMAIVLDEYGGTAGIVTLEDLFEEIVGEIQDEFDMDSEKLIHIAPGILETAGDCPVEDLDEIVRLGEPNKLPPVETVSGLLMTWLGRPPQLGDRYTYIDTTFTVIAVEGHAASRIRIEFPKSDR